MCVLSGAVTAGWAGGKAPQQPQKEAEEPHCLLPFFSLDVASAVANGGANYSLRGPSSPLHQVFKLPLKNTHTRSHTLQRHRHTSSGAETGAETAGFLPFWAVYWGCIPHQIPVRLWPPPWLRARARFWPITDTVDTTTPPLLTQNNTFITL